MFLSSLVLCLILQNSQAIDSEFKAEMAWQYKGDRIEWAISTQFHFETLDIVSRFAGRSDLECRVSWGAKPSITVVARSQGSFVTDLRALLGNGLTYRIERGRYFLVYRPGVERIDWKEMITKAGDNILVSLENVPGLSSVVYLMYLDKADYAVIPGVSGAVTLEAESASAKTLVRLVLTQIHAKMDQEEQVYVIRPMYEPDE